MLVDTTLNQAIQKTYTRVLLLLPLFFVLITINSYSQNPWDFDTTFNSTGFVHSEFAGNNDESTDIAIQPDGKIVIVGGVKPYSGDETTHFGVIRYNPDGTLDATFGSGSGTVTTIIEESSNPDKVLIQPDGKILVAGYSTNSSFNSQFTIVRYNSDGSLDNSFGTGGIYTNNPTANDDEIVSLALLPNGKIIAVGESEFQAVIFRLNSNGTLDGSCYYQSSLINSVFNDVRVLSNGRIIVCGYGDNVGNRSILIARFNSDLTPDNTYRSGNYYFFLTVPNSGGFEAAYSMAVQSTGKIIIGGSYMLDVSPNDLYFLLTRLNSDGSFDNTFGTNGIAVSHFFNDNNDLCDIAVDSYDKIIAVGSSVSFHNYVTIAQFNPNGSPDLTFNSIGAMNIINDDYTGTNTSIAIQSNGAIVVGTTYTGSPSYDFAAIRLNGTPPIHVNIPTLPVWGIICLIGIITILSIRYYLRLR